MSERIEVGDLVMVVRPRLCGCASNIGFVFRVQEVQRAGGLGGRCVTCGRHTFGPEAMIAVKPDGAVTELNRLRRIPPLTEPAHHEEKETA
jgi:hypothetical protein